jgi:hypothetical protein
LKTRGSSPAKRGRAADGRTEANPKANGRLTGMPAAAELAAAEAAHIPASGTAEAAYVAKVSAGEMTTTVETEAPVEAVVKAVAETRASDEDRTTVPVP